MALLPPAFLNAVVALGQPDADGKTEFNATGFLYGHPTGETDENDKKRYLVYLVTNRHVFEGAANRQPVIQARFNRPTGSGANIYTLRLTEPDGSTGWTVHPDPAIDAAVLRLNPNALKGDGIEFHWFPGDDQTFNLDQAREAEVSEGDGVFVLGFPLGQAGEERNYAIVRQGIIARAQDWLRGGSQTFLIDASIFPGNSGGPVLLKPEVASIKGTKSNTRCGLIGMVASYLTYQEIAISTQTNRPRMIFEENSGLGVVVPHDAIVETIVAHLKRVGVLATNGAPSDTD